MLSEDDLAELEGFWNALWTDLGRRLDDAAYDRIRPFRGEGH